MAVIERFLHYRSAKTTFAVRLLPPDMPRRGIGQAAMTAGHFQLFIGETVQYAISQWSSWMTALVWREVRIVEPINEAAYVHR